VKCHVTLVPRDANGVPYKKTLLRMNFPVTAETFRKEFSKQLRENQQAERKYDTSRSCILIFDAGQFGKISFTCDRAFSALRWTITPHSQRNDLHLLNDTGLDAAVSVSWLEFDRPTIEKKWESILPGAAPESGGLFVASVDKFTAAVVVPPIVQKFDDITGGPISRTLSLRTPAYLSDLLRFYSLWHDAKLSGNFASTTRRSNVLHWISLQFVSALCGEAWRNLEANPPRFLIDALRREMRRHPEDAFIEQEIIRFAQNYSTHSPNTLIGFLIQMSLRSTRLAPRGLAKPQVQELCEIAYQLLSQPGEVASRSGTDLSLVFKRLINEVPTLCRATRLLIIATNPDRKS